MGLTKKGGEKTRENEHKTENGTSTAVDGQGMDAQLGSRSIIVNSGFRAGFVFGSENPDFYI